MTAQPSTVEPDSLAPLTTSAPARDNLPPRPTVELATERANTTMNSISALAVALDRPARRISVRGELDMATVPILADVLALLLYLEPGSSTIDLSGMTFIDAAGLGCLVDHAAQVTAVGSTTSVVGVPARLQRTFDIAGLAHLVATS